MNPIKNNMNSDEKPKLIKDEPQDYEIKHEVDLKTSDVKNQNAVNKTVLQATCELCQKTFASKSTLKNHSNHVHQLLKPHRCDYCEKSFHTPSHLKKHIASTHKVNCPQPEKCEMCEKFFKDKAGLKEHVKNIHNNEQRYHCNICDEKFKYEVTFKKHFASHTDSDSSKEFKCEVCSKSLVHQNL